MILVSTKGTTSIPAMDDDIMTLLLYLERNFNEGSRTYSDRSTRNDTTVQYQPGSTEPFYEIQTYLIPKSDLEIIHDRHGDRLTRLFEMGDNVLFCAHPDTLADETYPGVRKILDTYERGPKIRVSPTASTRSVIAVHPDFPDLCIKMHLDKRISRFSRTLGPITTRHCVEASRLLTDYLNERKPIAGVGFGILREEAGCVLDKLPVGQKSWGFLLREMKPYPYATQKRYLVPLFSLYSHDKYDDRLDPLLVSLIRANVKEIEDRESVLQYALDNVFYPMIDNWIDVVENTGVLMELHGQNTLVEIDEEGRITSIFHES